MTPAVATYVAAHARDIERREHDAMFKHDIYATSYALASSEHAVNYAVFADGNPEFIFGAFVDPAMPHVVQIWGVGTDRTDRHLAKEIERFIRTKFTRELTERGVRRAEVRVSENNRSSMRWLEKNLGAKFEARLPNYGRSGETFNLLAWYS